MQLSKWNTTVKPSWPYPDRQRQHLLALPSALWALNLILFESSLFFQFCFPSLSFPLLPSAYTAPSWSGEALLSFRLVSPYCLASPTRMETLEGSLEETDLFQWHSSSTWLFTDLAAAMGDNVCSKNKTLMDRFLTVLALTWHLSSAGICPPSLWQTCGRRPDEHMSPSVAWVSEQCVLSIVSLKGSTMEDIKK